MRRQWSVLSSSTPLRNDQIESYYICVEHKRKLEISIFVELDGGEKGLRAN